MRSLLIITLACVLGSLSAGSNRADESAEDAFVSRRKELAHRQRRVILNNDGCDALYFPKSKPATPDNFLAQRTSPLVGSHVDTLFYCSITAGFGLVTHDTRAGELLTRQVGDILHVAGTSNITEPLIRQGTDPLKLVVDFCREQQMECFWSMRMNDTHDAAHRPEKPYPLFPLLKTQHPEYLVGSLAKLPKHGSWSSVDYGRPEIRELAFRYIQEVCRNYDVDGVELDFLRHATHFKSVAYGGTASDRERQLMTDLLRRVRGMADDEGRRRGRPILIAIRVPDSVEYSRAIGLDLKQWLAEGLVDLLIGSCYFQLNPWEYLVGLGHKYGVTVYPGLSESRVAGETPLYRRQSADSYRARALRAWQAGADGIYLFNFFNASAPMLREIGDPELLRTLSRTSFATVRDGDPNRYLADGRSFQNVPVITPARPLSLAPGQPVTIDLFIGGGRSPQATESEVALHVFAAPADGLAVKLNGTALDAGTADGGWLDYPLDPALVRAGRNEVELCAARPVAGSRTAEQWTVEYTGDAKLAPPWQSDRPRPGTLSEIRDGGLFVADRGDQPGDYLYHAYPWNASAEAQSVVEARVRVVSGWNNIIVCNGVACERVGLYPDHIDLYEAKLKYPMDTTDDFHLYRVVTEGRDIRVYVDGQLRLDGAGKLTAPSPAGRNDVRFGAANSGTMGEAYWGSVRIRAASAFTSVYDLTLTIRP